MKATRRHETEPSAPEHTDHRLPGACPTCGGDLLVRVSSSGARGYCGRCTALTRPMMITNADGWRIHHRVASA
jgi:hypothetical protein